MVQKKTRARSTKAKGGKKRGAKGGGRLSGLMTFTRRIFLVFFAAVLCLVGILFVYDYFDSAKVSNFFEAKKAVEKKVEAVKSVKPERERQEATASTKKADSGKREKIDIPDRLEIPRLRREAKEQVIRHEGYTLSYNSDYRISNWVAYELTAKEATSQRAERSNKFVVDPDVKGATAYNEDYTRTGYDRGHMAPAGDMKWSLKAMRESFYLSNICPQKPGLNRGVWKDLEEQVRLWAKENGRVWIACGPVISSDMRRLGKNRVGIPKSFYKVLCMEVNGKMEGIGFLFENRDYENGVSPRKMAVTIDSVENLTGIDFFPALPDAVEGEMEATINWSRWSF